jgi:hypothetical protein
MEEDEMENEPGRARRGTFFILFTLAFRSDTVKPVGVAAARMQREPRTGVVGLRRAAGMVKERMINKMRRF